MSINKLLCCFRYFNNINLLFFKNIEQVEEMREGDDSKKYHIILEQCLQDADWIESVSLTSYEAVHSMNFILF